MGDSGYILLYIVIISVTFIVLLIGWQIYQILGEIRKLLTKSNLMADQFVSFGEKMSHSLDGLREFTDGLKAVFHIFHILKKKEEDHEK